jgi:hypothetical protein
MRLFATPQPLLYTIRDTFSFWYKTQFASLNRFAVLSDIFSAVKETLAALTLVDSMVPVQMTSAYISHFVAST